MLHINTVKIQTEMKRLGLTYHAIGQLHKPKFTRQAIWIMVHSTGNLDAVTWLASVLEIEDPKDLVSETP